MTFKPSYLLPIIGRLQTSYDDYIQFPHRRLRIILITLENTLAYVIVGFLLSLRASFAPFITVTIFNFTIIGGFETIIMLFCPQLFGIPKGMTTKLWCILLTFYHCFLFYILGYFLGRLVT